MLFCARMLTTAWLDLLYPPACLLCEARAPLRQEPVCPDCSAAAKRLRSPCCVVCGTFLEAAFDARLRCAECRDSQPAFEMARAPWHYDGLIARAVQSFKYNHRWRLGSWLAREMLGCALKDLPVDAIDTVVAVPGHWLKNWWRAGSAAERLGRRVAGGLSKPYARGGLRATRWPRSQTRLSRAERKRNVAGCFSADARKVAGRRILLVDDVLTTGSTAHACAKALKSAGARSVHVLTAARTPSAN